MVTRKYERVMVGGVYGCVKNLNPKEPTEYDPNQKSSIESQLK